MKEDGTMAQSKEREQELQKLIETITEVHLEQTPHTQEFYAKLPDKEAQFLVRRLCFSVIYKVIDKNGSRNKLQCHSYLTL